MPRNKVSVICITYNHERFIEQTIQGFTDQITDLEIEIIIADDASTDSTAAIIKRASIADKRIKPILREKNVGVQNNLLDAMNRASGTYIALCEGDDFWTDPNKLMSQVALLDAEPDLAGCFHPVEVFFENADKPAYRSPSTDFTKDAVTIDDIIRENIIPTNSVLYRNKGGYESLNHNVMPLDWYLHAYHAADGPIKYMDEIMAKNRRHSGGVWWEAQNKPADIWVKYWHGWLELQSELIRYATKDDAKAVFNNRLADMVETISGSVRPDIRINMIDDLLGHKALREPFLSAYTDRYGGMAHSVSELTKHSDEQGKVIHHLENENSLITAKLHDIRRSLPWRLYSSLRRVKKDI